MERQTVVAVSSVESGAMAWDLKSGALLKTYKVSASARNSAACLGQHYLACAQQGKGGIFAWSWAKEQPQMRSFLAEEVTCLAATEDGVYCIGGTKSGAISIWEANSGQLLVSWRAHFKPVSVLRLSDDDTLVASAGKDGVVSIWSIPALLDWGMGAAGASAFDNHAPDPLLSWSEHTLPVTDLWWGSGGSNGLLVSCSLDRTCKMWSLAQRHLLQSIVFPSPLLCVTADSAEFCLYAGSDGGQVYEVPLQGSGSGAGRATLMATDSTSTLTSPLEDASRNTSSGGGLGPPSLLTSHGNEPFVVLRGHSQGVSCLAVSLEGSHLVTGSLDGTLAVWDILSRQMVRRLVHGKGPVTNLLIIPTPPALLPNREGERGGARGQVPPLVPFRKYVGLSSERQVAPWEGTPIFLHGTQHGPMGAESFALAGDMAPTSSMAAAWGGLEGDVMQSGDEASSLGYECAQLRAQLDKALAEAKHWQSLHQELFSVAAQQLASTVVGGGSGATRK
eukprot:jgi/Mesvir1/24689/Mv21978-RA.1